MTAPLISAPLLILGARGLVGSAVVRAARVRHPDVALLTPPSTELNLMDARATHAYFARQKPGSVLMAAARVGGIEANRQDLAGFLADNLLMATHSIQAAEANGVSKFLFLGSSCIYPKLAAQPIREDSLLTGALEPTNEGYALAKIAGLKLCEYLNRQKGRRFISAMPTNLYGPGDNFHPEHSHVIPGMMRRFHEAKRAGADAVTIWGSGSPRREFLHVDDLARALLLLLERYEKPETINVGVGEDVTILELAQLMKRVTGFAGEIRTDPGKPDGTPRKLLDVTRIHGEGWRAEIPLERGLRETYAWALEKGVLT